MVTHIADILHYLSTTGSGSAGAGTRTGSDLTGQISWLQARAAALSTHALYSFDISALEAAADLDSSDPDMLERVFDAILETPQSIFLEAAGPALLSSFRRPMAHLPVDRAHPHPAEPLLRVGIFLSVTPARHMTLESLLLVNPRRAGLPDPLARAHARLSRLPAGTPRHRARIATSLLPGPDIEIHPSATRMSLEEYRSFATRIAPGADPAIDRLRREEDLEAALPAYWRLARLEALFRARPSGQKDHVCLSFPPALLSLAAISMIALLQSRTPALKLNAPHSATGKRRARAGSPDKTAAPGLSTVRLVLDDPGLQALYDGTAGGRDPETPTGSGEGRTGSRAWHPVRGHLFLARNGKLTWRRPHWRGDPAKPVLHKVVARPGS